MPRRLLFRVSGAACISFALVLAACSRSESTDLTQDGPIQVCIHNRLSQWECPDSLPTVTLSGQVQSVTVSGTLAGGGTFSYTLPGNTDGIFLTKASTEMFLLRYYDATNKAEAKKLKKYLDGKP